MSEFTTRKITDRAGTGAPSFTYGLNSGGSDSGLIGKAYTASGTEPSSPANGDTWYDSTNDKYYIYADGAFKQVTHSNAVVKIDSGSRATVSGGYWSSLGARANVIQYYEIGTLGNATDFGDLIAVRGNHTGGSDGTTGFAIGGTSGSSRYLNIDRWVIATTGNATDHGDLTQRPSEPASNCDGTNMVVMCGSDNNDTVTNVMERFTTATASNATDHGDMTVSRRLLGGGMSNGTNGVFAGGYTGSVVSDVIDQTVLATAGNSTDFGDMTSGGYTCHGTSNHTRGVFQKTASSGNGSNVLEYITIATTANSADFGDLTDTLSGCGACANLEDRGVWNGGNHPFNSPYQVNVIQYITISTTGNATDFGDLLATASANPSASSGAAS